MSLVLTCNRNREMSVKIGDDVEVIVCVERGMIKAVINAPRELAISNVVTHVAGFTEKKVKFYRGSDDVEGNS